MSSHLSQKDYNKKYLMSILSKKIDYIDPKLNYTEICLAVQDIYNVISKNFNFIDDNFDMDFKIIIAGKLKEFRDKNFLMEEKYTIILNWHVV